MSRQAAVRWTVLALGALACVIVPYLLFQGRVYEALAVYLEGDFGRGMVVGAIVGCLSADIALPVPSSVVATASGMLLGLPLGAFVTWVGMQVGAFTGYAIGRSFGASVARRFVGAADFDRAAGLHRVWGGLALIAARAVPVLAETSVVFAGTVRMRLARFALITSVSNAAIAVVYAAAGSRAADFDAFYLAFAASVLVPLAAAGAYRVLTRWRAPAAPARGRPGGARREARPR